MVGLLFRRRHPRFYAAGAPTRFAVSARRLGRAAANPVRGNRHLRGDRAGDHPATGSTERIGAGRRRRRGAQSRQHRRALPPRRREQRKPDGLCGRHYAESAASESRTGGNVGIVRSEKRDRIVGGRPLSRLLV